MNDVDLSRVLDSIYDAALSPVRWPLAMQVLTDCVDSGFSGLVVQDEVAGSFPLAAVDPRTPVEVLAQYAAYYGHHDPLRHAAVQRTAEVLTDADIVTQEIRRSETYNDFYVPHRMSRFIGYAWRPDDTRLASLVIYNDAPGDAFSQDDEQALTLIVPHLRRAVQMTSRLGNLTVEIESLRDVLDHFSAAVVLVNRQGRVIEMNAAAREVLARRDGLRESDGELTGPTPRDTAALRALVAAAISGDALVSPRHVLVPRPSGQPALSVIAMPYRVGGRVLGAMVTMADTSSFPPHFADHLRGRFGWTRSECDIALRIASGSSVSAIALARGCSEHTVRSQVKQVLQKASARSQTELVTMILRDPAAQLHVRPGQ